MAGFLLFQRIYFANNCNFIRILIKLIYFQLIRFNNSNLETIDEFLSNEINVNSLKSDVICSQSICKVKTHSIESFECNEELPGIEILFGCSWPKCLTFIQNLGQKHLKSFNYPMIFTSI